MDSLLKHLFSGSTRFFLDKKDFQPYQIVYAIATSENEWKDKANSLIVRAKLKEPMDFDVEAEKLFLDIIYANIKQR